MTTGIMTPIDVKKGLIGRKILRTEKAAKPIRALAEAVILQAIEDLYSPTTRAQSIEFFRGEGFSTYAELAGMNEVEKLRLIMMLGQTFPV